MTRSEQIYRDKLAAYTRRGQDDGYYGRTRKEIRGFDEEHNYLLGYKTGQQMRERFNATHSA